MGEVLDRRPAPAVSNNIEAYAAVKATHVGGFKQVDILIGLYELTVPQLSETGGGEDAIGQEWYVRREKRYYRLIDFSKRGTIDGWQPIYTDSELAKMLENLSSKYDDLLDKYNAIIQGGGLPGGGTTIYLQDSEGNNLQDSNGNNLTVIS